MLLRLRNIWLRDHVAHMAGLQLCLVILLTATVAIAAASPNGPTFSAPLPSTGLREGALVAAVLTADTSDAADLIRLQDLDPEAARLWNAANPTSTLPNPPARPFRLDTPSLLDEARAVDCLTAAIYYEAVYESLDGQRAVAQVVLNRLRHPAYPKTVCGVVFQGSERKTGCQFTFTCDGALKARPVEPMWSRTREVARAALAGQVMKKVGNATHYHANYVAPYWSPNLVKVGTIGAHIFYRWTGGWGLPPAFDGTHAGRETAGVQIATFESLAEGDPKLRLAAVTQRAAIGYEAALEPVVPVSVDVEKSRLITAPAEAPTLLQPDEIDWLGRPKPKAAPRLAMPGAAPNADLPF